MPSALPAYAATDYGGEGWDRRWIATPLHNFKKTVANSRFTISIACLNLNPSRLISLLLLHYVAPHFHRDRSEFCSGVS